MELFRVENGWTGNGTVRVLVIAASESAAVDAAVERYQEAASDRGYPPGYWQREAMKAELLCSDCSAPWSSDVDDD